MDCSPPDSSVHGFLQARIVEWVAISFFRGSSQSRDHLHCRQEPQVAEGESPVEGEELEPDRSDDEVRDEINGQQRIF